MESTLSQNEWSQFGDNNIHGSVEKVHEHHQWHPFGSAGFADAYRKVKAHLLIRFRCGDSQEFIACFQRDWRKEVFGDEIWESLARLQEKSFWEATCRRNLLSWSEGAHRVYDAHSQEKAVLVDDVEPMEVPQEGIASLVWTDTVERFESLLAYGWYYSAQDGPVVLGRISDWELRVGSDDWDKTASEVIESATKTMENIAKDQRNLSGDNWDIADVVSEVSRLGVNLLKSGHGVSIVKPPHSRLQFLDVLLGPIQLV